MPGPASEPRNHFERLGIAPAYSLDARELEHRYLEGCLRHHPDHAGSDPKAQLAALDASSQLNEAYRVLRDPAGRGEYLLMLLGGVSAEQDRSLPEGFLQLILELREGIESARERGDTALAESLLRQVRQQYDELVTQLEHGFAQPVSAAGLRNLRRSLNGLRYLDRIVQTSK